MTNDNDTTTIKKKLRPVEVGAGAGAAVITAFASSYLGTAGTLTGAAVASVVGTVSTSLLRTSAETSAARLRETTARLKQQTHADPGDPVDPYGTQLLSGRDWIDPDKPAGPTELFSTGTTPVPERHGRRVRPRWVMVGAGAVAAFALALIAITGIESAAGKPLAGLVGKESGGGTTLGRATGNDERAPAGPAAPSSTPGPTPTDTGTGTSPAPAPPTGEPTGTGQPTPQPTPTGPGATSAPPTQAPSPQTTP
jgi:hypothetical protein